MSAWQDGFTATGIHYTRTGGDLPPLLLAHGFTDYSLCWTRTAQALESDYDIIMPDARGHGQSPSPAGEYTSELHAEDIAAVIAELNPGQPPVMGHSMGAMNAMYLAANHPGNIGAAILVDPPWRTETEAPRSSEFWQDWKRRMASDKALSDDELIARIQDDNPGWHRLEVETKAQAIQQFDMLTFDIYSLTRRPWRDALPQVQCPALLLYADDGIVTDEAAGIAESLAPNLAVQKIAGAGHSIQRDRFDLFIAAVQDYLKHLAWA